MTPADAWQAISTASMTSTDTGPVLTQEMLRAKFREWGNLIRESRRTNVTVVVVQGHEGAPTISKHPTDGQFVECSFAQAHAVNRQTPLRLVKIISEDRAHFEVALPLHGMFVPLCAPPYTLPAPPRDGDGQEPR